MKIITDVDTRGFDTMVAESIKGLDSPSEKRKMIRAHVLRFIQEVIPRTPVDTGRARGGWSAAAGRVGSIRSLGGSTSDSRYVEKFSKGQASAEITNGVPYIVYLELGSSQQAPSGFVRLALREISDDLVDESVRRTEAALRAANIKARRAGAAIQGRGGRRPSSGRINLRRR